MTRRRGNREGSIRRRADGRWEGRLAWVSPEGRLFRKSVYAKTRRDLQIRLDRLRIALERGTSPSFPERQTTGRFLMHWLEHAARPSLRPRTFSRYAELLKLHILPALGRIPLSRLNPQHVQHFLNGKLSEGLAPLTVRQIRAVLRRALGQAEAWGLVTANAAALTQGPKVERYNARFLTAQEAKTLLEACRGHRLEAFFTLALTTGMREGELLGLRWGSMDPEGGTLKVEAQLQRIGGKPQLVPPKSSRSRRTLKLPNLALEALRVHRTRQALERLKAGSVWDNGLDLVFTSQTGRPLDPNNLKRTLQSLLRKAGLPRIRIHDLRHSTASFLLSQGVALKMVSELLGHSQISMTADTYGHLAPEALEEVARRIDEVLSQ